MDHALTCIGGLLGLLGSLLGCALLLEVLLGLLLVLFAALVLAGHVPSSVSWSPHHRSRGGAREEGVPSSPGLERREARGSLEKEPPWTTSISAAADCRSRGCV